LLNPPEIIDSEQIEDWKHLSFPASMEDMEGSQELVKDERDEMDMED
jgi:hypothetical protein